jgi:hypothetical protein
MPTPTAIPNGGDASADWLGVISSWAGIIGLLVTIFGLMITLITFVRVGKLAAARSEERNRFARALKLRELTGIVRADAEILSGDLTPIERDKVRADLIQVSTEVDAASRLLLPDRETGVLEGVAILESGYWEDQFAEERVKESTRRLDIVTWRNSRILSVGLLESIIDQLARYPGLVVRIFAISRACPETVYQDMCKMLNLGSPAGMRSEQVHHLGTAIDILAERLQSGVLTHELIRRLHYFEISSATFLHCVVTDDKCYWGINFFMNQAIGATPVLGRSYARAAANSVFGRKVAEQVAVLAGLPQTVEINLIPGPSTKVAASFGSSGPSNGGVIAKDLVPSADGGLGIVPDLDRPNATSAKEIAEAKVGSATAISAEECGGGSSK